jgi:hypothetical protein
MSDVRACEFSGLRGFGTTSLRVFVTVWVMVSLDFGACSLEFAIQVSGFSGLRVYGVPEVCVEWFFWNLVLVVWNLQSGFMGFAGERVSGLAGFRGGMGSGFFGIWCLLFGIYHPGREWFLWILVFVIWDLQPR